MKDFAILLAVLALALGIHFLRARLYRDKDDTGPELSGTATVVSRRVDQGRFAGKSTTRWNYLMTFALADGEEVELYVTDDIFSSLKDGQTGLLTWQGKRFYRFEADI